MLDDPVTVACVAAPLFASLMAKHGEVELDDVEATQHRLACTALSQARVLLEEARRPPQDLELTPELETSSAVGPDAMAELRRRLGFDAMAGLRARLAVDGAKGIVVRRDLLEALVSDAERTR